MKNTYLQANLVSLNRINVLLFTSIALPNNPVFFLEKDGDKVIKLKINRHTSSAAVNIYDLEMSENFEYGHSYSVVLEGFNRIAVDVSDSTDFPDFDKNFYYDGDDLGAIYSKEETKFALWAPLASEVRLKLDINGVHSYYRMVRGDKGVFRLTLKGDFLNAKYHYLVTNSGATTETNDPWGRGVSFNSEWSAVVDIEQIKNIKNIKPEKKIARNADAIVYEASIRDFTEDKNTNIVNKGKFLGLTEEGRTTKGGHPAGLDYLKYLGITHLQILPVMDFFGNDDKDITKSYNWGYNPISFFAVEGSYSTKPEDPMNRLIEFKAMVETLHKNNIRVVMDVVYNHLYEFMYTSFEKVVPHYFYRRRANGLQACASGCGDDFASEKLMARKAILESLKYFTEVFDIDGYRFDLMGLMDIDTVNQGFAICKNIKDDVIFYGEGWNMGIELPFEKKACSENADKMPGIGFFNDTYRDILRGGNFRDSIHTKGFVGGNFDNNGYIEYLFKGCTTDSPVKHRFLDFNQSLNYVECHDNNTLYDKLTFSNGREDQNTLLKRVEFANKMVILSFGIGFIHMGQEIGLSKSGLDNTYNVIKVNNMDWKLVDERFDMVERLASIIFFRQKMVSYFPNEKFDDIPKLFKIDYWHNGMLALIADNEAKLYPYKKLLILYNPTLDKKTYELDEYYQLLVDVKSKGENIMMKNGMIAPLSIQILFLKKE